MSMERGLNGRHIRNYYEETIIKCSKTVTRYREDLGMSDVFSAFLILFGGFFIALVILYLEIFMMRRKKACLLVSLCKFCRCKLK